MKDPLLEFIVREKLVSEQQLQIAMGSVGEGAESVVRALMGAKVLDENQLQKTLADRFSLQTVTLSRLQMAAIKLLPLEKLKELRCLPFQIEADQRVRVAIVDPTDPAIAERIQSLLGRPVLLMLATFSGLEAAHRTIAESGWSSQARKTQGRAANEATLSKLSVQNTPEAASPAPPGRAEVVKSHAPAAHPDPVNNFSAKIKTFRPQDTVVNILNEVMAEAVTKGASDIHIEPEAKLVRIRFRLEGPLYDVFRVPPEHKDALISRTKVIAGLDISERRVPQDGRVMLKVGNVDVGFRVNVMPSLYGENIVLRVLRQDDLKLDMTQLGLDQNQFNTLQRAIESPSGMILVTGPTGSGKTTTLYTALSAMNKTTIKIATLEDPIEYNLNGITQVQINKDTGLDFAEVLKSLLRQDPDVILVGEIRDQETAKVAVQAALTGHIVLTSLHTNDAPSAIIRLLNMGVDTFATLESIRTVVAQRLVRQVCPHCAVKVSMGSDQLKLLGADRKLIENGRLMRGAGCAQCLGGGYRGRAAIFEVLELNDSLKEMFLKGENLIAVRRRAIADGMTTLRQSALALAAAGITSIEEAVSATLET